MKIKALSFGLTALLAQNALAGTMGNVMAGDYFVPFVAADASVTWNTVKAATIFGTPPSITKNLWGGRGAVGVAHSFVSRFGYTAELGWGYYGSSKSYSYGASGTNSLMIQNSSSVYGLDMLVGLTYDLMPFQVYLKGGAMAENRQIKGYTEFRGVNNNVNYLSTNAIQTTATNVLPEIKVGGLYALNDKLSLSLAYQHVFGNDNYAATVTGAFSNPNAGSGISSVVNAQVPSLDSILFGLVYQFK